MSKSDERKMQALVKKLSAQSARKKPTRRRQYDPTLQTEDEDDPERRAFFSEMKKREF